MDRRPLGRSTLTVTPIGFGAFKIGRNVGAKYPRAYDLPDDAEAARILHAMLDLGIGYIDTAPAYGLSEQRIGDALHARRDQFTLSTKVGETFEEGRSTYDFSGEAIEASVARSLRRLRTDCVDLLLIHSDGDDLRILERTDAVATLRRLRERGMTRAIGLSGKTDAGFRASLDWADAVMVEYHAGDTGHLGVMREAHARGVGVIVKKGLASGTLDAAASVRFVFEAECVDALVIGTLNEAHMRANIAALPGQKN